MNRDDIGRFEPGDEDYDSLPWPETWPWYEDSNNPGKSESYARFQNYLEEYCSDPMGDDE